MTQPSQRSVAVPAQGQGRETITLRYRDWGGQGQPVLLLHGVGLTSHTWDGACAQLHGGYRCIVPDLRGHGESEWSPDGDYSLSRFVGDLGSLVDAVGVERPVVMGMSLGGSIALTYGGLFPDRVRALVLVDLALSVRLVGSARIRAFMAGPTEADTIEEFVERAIEFNPRRDRSALRRSLRHNLRQTPEGRWTWRYDPAVVTSPTRVQSQREQRLLGSAAMVICPTLVVRGGASDVTTDEEAARLAGSFAIGSWVKIEGASHNVQGDRPQELAREVDEFLTRLPD